MPGPDRSAAKHGPLSPVHPDEQRIPHSLELIHHINERLLSLMVALSDSAIAGTAQATILTEVGDALRQLDAAGRRRLVRCPFCLVDAGFRDPNRWRNPQAGPGANALLAGDQQELRVSLARSTFLTAWHLTRTDPVAAEISLGVSPACADVISALSMQEIDLLADQYPHWVQPRWLHRPDIWHRLVALAQRPPPIRLSAVSTRGLQLFLGELFFGAHDHFLKVLPLLLLLN